MILIVHTNTNSNTSDSCCFLCCCSVYSYPVAEGKSGQSVVEMLQRQIELLGAVKAGHFCVDCDTFQSILQSSINGLCQ